ncbi:MAG: hypothetical protein KUA35_00085 [Pseudodesulfovibrio sp.]|uniref:Uncharacterized protein n=1 Tax=Pseudodesulfovibrio aespoeensis (strain ATCC 700646 / DSM 10631 / Aspo-2) TaxID=643562 RepID=E6VVU6_PSEA9|nr:MULTISPECIES: hypothetical protein [Pseudodesulfovibrio]MBU4243920.1 hypothetical protein [Pseudomonadota bacterium]ADU61298.1 hypothetical protein Daes_0271 [Pseudodesulfovibrio aespoeensis Aspo-2]MBU4379343.1 hypothetical protein [Pseudomonadota bacterium]MBU4474525.1 hypothetical protein [Pseudomonadota bacterium]MBU4517107.1 hypothetical protein [Pseudomonadota bacterium]
MKRPSAFIILALILLSAPCLAAEPLPLTLSVFTLGKDVDLYQSYCDGSQGLSQTDIPFLSETNLRADSVPGVRGGSLTHGNCLGDRKLLRVKLKFHDTSQKFFNALLKEYTKQFGEPDSYQGDTFKNVIAWQWNFARGKEAVSLLLMWSRDKEMRPGVSIKMTLESLLDAEYDCYKAAFDKQEKDQGGPTAIRNLNDFVPR